VSALLDFSDKPSASSYDPTNPLFTVKIDRTMPESVDASLSPTVTTGFDCEPAPDS